MEVRITVRAWRSFGRHIIAIIADMVRIRRVTTHTGKRAGIVTATGRGLTGQVHRIQGAAVITGKAVRMCIITGITGRMGGISGIAVFTGYGACRKIAAERWNIAGRTQQRAVARFFL